MTKFFLLNCFSFFVTFILAPSHVVDSLWSGFTISLADLIDSFLMNLIQHLFSISISFLEENQIIKPASEAVDLHVVQEELVQASHQFSSGSFAIQFSKRMQESVI